MTVESPVTITDTGLRVDPDFDEWEARGKTLVEEVHTALKRASTALFAVGDWYLEGEARFGERASQAVDGFTWETIRGAIRVCRRIDPVLRRPDLGFSIHKEVASLKDPAEQEHLERIAEGAVCC